MAYEPSRKEAVLFGGAAIYGDPLGDTWTWSAGCWVERFPDHGPHPEHDVVMAFDAVRGLTVLYTPGLPLGTERATWTWDGADWTKVADGPAIYGYEPASMAYDQVTGKVVLFGATSTNSTETWTWSGTAWQAMAPLHAPPARRNSSMAFDPNTSRVLLFGGMTLGDRRQQDDTWAWDGSDWTQLHPQNSPAPREGAVMATFGAKSQVLLLGGSSTVPLSDAWTWDGVTWHEAVSPGPRQKATAVDAGDSVLVFGGTLQSTANTDTWDGAIWRTA